jgi:cation-transporting ATPase I
MACVLRTNFFAGRHMSIVPGLRLSALADWLPRPPERRQRRQWTGNGRAHIEVKGVHQREHADLARQVEDELAQMEGVRWAAVIAPLGRVVVAFDDSRLGADDLIKVIERAEEVHGVAAEQYPAGRPEHPADTEPLHRQMHAIGTEILGVGLGLAGRVVRAQPVLPEVASLVSLADAMPAVRRRLEDWLGYPVADLGLVASNAIAQGLAQGPFGLLADIANRVLRLDELRARQAAWQRREPELSGPGEVVPPSALSGAPRPAPLPPGPVESYANRAARAAAAGGAATGLLTRDVRTTVAAAVAATPKAARLGREGFAARLGRDLARSGVLAMDDAALRRLDRVDTVVLDAAVLTTGRTVISTVWVSPDHDGDDCQLRVTAQALLDPAAPAVTVRRGRWALGPAPRRLGGVAGDAARALRGPGRRVLALRRDGDLAGLVVTEPELDPLAAALVGTARLAGPVIVAGRHGRVGERVHADRVVPGGRRMASSVRALQAEGHGVAVVSSREHEALAAADVGIGVLAGQPPWGAALLTGAGLADACLILQAIAPARAVSRRAAMLAAYGSGVGALLALAGPRSGSSLRALIGVNGASFVSLASGLWSARTLALRPPPVPAATTSWHALAADAVLAKLASSPRGLGESEAARRRGAQPGRPPAGEPGLVRSSMEELANPLTPALASGAVMSAASGSVMDAALIGGVMAANALVGGVQRVGAHRALRHLVDESAVRVRLRRGGEETLTTADRLVAGDVIIVQAGDAVPADCRILEANGVEVDESSLTGESRLVPKSAAPAGAVSVAERRSMLYTGTSVAAGTATAVVVAVGPATELGRSEEAARGKARPSGVEERLNRLTRTTVPVSLGAGVAVIAAGMLRGRPVSRMLGTGVSLAVAAVPEGLPIVATVAELSTARRLSRRNALVRNPGTIEALGRVDALCFDKTGTLTEGRITLHRVWAAGAGQPLGTLDAAGRAVLAAALRASPEHRNGEPLAHPTDRAVVDGGLAAGVSAELGADSWQPVAELPFEPSRGYHAVLGRALRGYRLAVKGAPETVLPLCSHAAAPGTPVQLDEHARQALRGQADRLARRGYRVLAVAERDAAGRDGLSVDRIGELRFAGLLAFTDPVRDSAVRAVRGLRGAGVDMLMLTGDHPSTAEAVATELGLIDGRRVITGTELDALSDRELDRLIGQTGVFARVTPDQKVRIVAALQRAGRVVAVTGDGANDAPAIKLADVGVALGLRGTNAAKEAADVIVTDDRVETIIDAIAEGRAMWSSVRDAISVLLGGNLGEIAFTAGTSLLLPGGSPLRPRQLLLVNLLTDIAPSMALAVRPPSSATPGALLAEGPEASLGAALTRDVLIRGALTSSAGMAAWLGGRVTGITRGRAATIALIGIVAAQLGQTLMAGRHSPLVIAASLASAAVLAAVVQTPGVSQFFGCRPVGPLGWAIGLAVAAAASLLAPAMAGLPLAERGTPHGPASPPCSPGMGEARRRGRDQH